MVRSVKRLNIVMGGGGVKGIAYVGAFDVLRGKGYLPANLAGVSSGAIAAALAGVGYNADGMWETLEALDFGKLESSAVGKRVPAVKYLAAYAKHSKLGSEEIMNVFLNQYANRSRNHGRNEQETLRGIIQSIITLSKEGCLFDGDQLEEWISGALLKKGIRTFADLRGGIQDEKNPSGYKVRMTGVDCNRLKVVTLPDDAAFYGIEPDDLEVAKAVRISTSVPFAFKPVIFSKMEEGSVVQYHLIDGGVLDPFPAWLLGNGRIPAAGFRLRSSKNKVLSLKTPLSIFKSLVTSVHDIGAPEDSTGSLTYMQEIDTGDVSFLDFDLTGEQKQQLFESGRKAALNMFT